MEKENRPYYKKLAILSWGSAPHPAREIISLAEFEAEPQVGVLSYMFFLS